MPFGDTTMRVNGYTVKLKDYTERRAAEFDKIDKEIKDHVEKLPAGTLYDAVDKATKAEWWMAKAQLLWEVVTDPADIQKEHWDRKADHFSKAFFMDEDFEYPRLQKTEVFFLNQKLYL